jgi:hypothetical protein
MVDSIKWVACGGSRVTDPISFLRVVVTLVWVPRDADYDDFLAVLVRGVVAHSQLCKAFLVQASGVPQVLYLGTSFLCERLPSLSPLVPSGAPFEFWIDGLPKSGCLRISATLFGSDFTSPCLTHIQDFTMLFHIEHWILFNLGVANSQLISRMLGPLLWTGSLIWSALYLTLSFQGSPPGDSPLTNSLASRTFDCAFGSIIPRPPWAVGSVRVSHLTLARAGASLPP